MFFPDDGLKSKILLCHSGFWLHVVLQFCILLLMLFCYLGHPVLNLISLFLFYIYLEFDQLGGEYAVIVCGFFGNQCLPLSKRAIQKSSLLGKLARSCDARLWGCVCSYSWIWLESGSSRSCCSLFRQVFLDHKTVLSMFCTCMIIWFLDLWKIYPLQSKEWYCSIVKECWRIDCYRKYTIDHW